MKIRLLKSVQIDGIAYAAGTVVSIEGDDEYCKQLIADGTAEAADKAVAKTVTSDPGTGSASASATTTATAEPITMEAAQKMVQEAVRTALEAEKKNVARRPNVVVTSTADDPKAGYKDAADFLYDIAAHASKQYGMRSGRQSRFAPSKRLDEWHRKAAGSDEYREISDPAGGFLIPEQLMTELLRIPPEMDPIGARTRKIRMQSRTLKIPKRVDETHTSSVSGGLTLAWTEETAAITTSQQTFKRLTLELHKLAGAVFVTEEIMSDSPISLVDIITSGFQDEYAKTLLRARLYGTGAGQPVGIVGVSAATVSVAKEAGQAAATIVAENVIKMYSRCWGYDNAVWLANHDTLPQLLTMSIAVGTGGSLVYQPSLVEGRPPTLLGRPIFFSEHAKTLGTVGDLVLANWMEYADAVSTSGVQSSSSAHVRFLNDELCFKFTFRADGRPLWDLPLTPAESSSTLSPFVTLATRA